MPEDKKQDIIPRERKSRMVPFSKIVIIPEIRIRVKGPSDAKIEEYKNLLLNDVELPPISVFEDEEGQFLLGDGEHRFLARVGLQQELISCYVNSENRKYARSMAIKEACEANQHGLQYTNADKHNSVKIVLADPTLRRLSDQRISRMCGVSAGLVKKLRTGEPMEKPVPVKRHERSAPATPAAAAASQDPADDPGEDRVKALKGWLKSGHMDWQTMLEILNEEDGKKNLYVRLPRKSVSIHVISSTGEAKDVTATAIGLTDDSRLRIELK